MYEKLHIISLITIVNIVAIFKLPPRMCGERALTVKEYLVDAEI